MANITLPYPYEIDWWVQNLQTRVWINVIKPKWGCTDTTYNSYGRAYRNRVNRGEGGSKGYIPEFYNPNTGNYDAGYGKNNQGGMFFDDRIAGLSYFGLIDPIKRMDSGYHMAKFQWLFFLNLSRITPNGISNAQNQRLDEVCVNDIRNFMQWNGCGFTVTGIVKDVDTVLERYSGQSKLESLSDDMHPRFCFRLDLELIYDPNQHTAPQIKQLLPMQISPVFYIKTTPNLTNVISVGNRRYIYAEYGEGNTFTPLYTDTGLPFLAGKNVNVPFFKNDAPITLPNYNVGTGTWTNIGAPNGFNDGDYITMEITNYV